MTGARSKTLSDAIDELVANDVVHRRMERAAPVAVFCKFRPRGNDLLEGHRGLDRRAQE